MIVNFKPNYKMKKSLMEASKIKIKDFHKKYEIVDENE